MSHSWRCPACVRGRHESCEKSKTLAEIRKAIECNCSCQVNPAQGVLSIEPEVSPPHMLAAHTAGTDTEAAAARAARLNAGTGRRRVLDALKSAGLDGLTDDELGTQTMMPRYSAAPRRLELAKGGLVRDSEKRRPTPTGSMAIVWTLTDEGHAAWSELERV